MTFMELWIGYAIVGVSLFSAAFVWAVRTRQFSDLDRARYIALKSVEPVEAEPSDHKISRLDRLSVLGLVLVTLSLFALAIWVGMRCMSSGACHSGLG